jgi:membrane protein DedA with SNARE-associated domain
MLTILGVILNLCILIYLGYQASSCLGPVQAGLNATQNPWFLSFVGVVALFFTLKN